MLLHLRNAIVLLGLLAAAVGLTYPTATVGIVSAMLPGNAASFASNEMQRGS